MAELMERRRVAARAVACPGLSEDRTLALLAGMLAVPFLLIGPGWILDDWIHLAGLRFDGWVNSAGYLWGSRPGAALVFAVAFGFVGSHPAWMLVLLTALGAANAIAFRRLAVRYLPRRHAFTAAAVWLLLPIRSATEHWAATLNISVATLLLLVGLLALVDATETGRGWGVVGLSLVGAVLCYEAVITVAAGACVLSALVGLRKRPPVVIFGLIAVVGLTMLRVSPKVGPGGRMFDYSALPSAHFGPDAFGVAAILVVPFLVLGCSLIVKRRGASEAAMIGVGVGVIAAGAAVFIRFHTQPVGIGDRVNAVMSFGVALIFAAAISALGRRRWVLALAVFAVLVMPARLDRSDRYAWAGDEATSMLSDAEVVDGFVTFPDCPVQRKNVTAFLGWWDVGAAARYHFDDVTLSGAFEMDAPIGRPSEDEPCRESGL